MLSHFYHFPSISQIPDIPPLPIPDYGHLTQTFRKELFNPKNNILRINPENGHPIFGAYLQSDSNEMVTWGILAVGEYLTGNETDWITPTFEDFFSDPPGIFLNSPGHKRVEHWYLFYVNTLAGVIYQTLFPQDPCVRQQMARSADTMVQMAKQLEYDFNSQGYDFSTNQPFTIKEIYRQPDSIAGYAYNMLFAALKAGRKEYLEQSVLAMRQYQAFPRNPWYEIPNGSAGLMAAVWLNTHEYPMDIPKIAGWLFDTEEGPFQAGTWGEECVDGLMMGWRGGTRREASDSAYSMESLMPLQFILPAVRYEPRLAKPVAKYVLNALSSFQLFYARGRNKLYETKPDLSPSIPYERIMKELDGYVPAACGDFWGHRSVYGAGYLCWMEAIAQRTQDRNIIALDLSLTDWLAEESLPVYLLRNPYSYPVAVQFSPAAIWQKKCPELLWEGRYNLDIYRLEDQNLIAQGTSEIALTLEPDEVTLLAAVPSGSQVYKTKGFLKCRKAELVYYTDMVIGKDRSK